jgi:hypothetical protein
MRANRFVPVVLVFAACGPSGDDGPDECATALLAGDVVITEVFADYDAVEGSGTDDGKEWFEIYNNAGVPLDLGGLTITHSRPDGSMAETHVLAATTLPADGYLVLGNVLPALVPGHVDYGYADELGDLYNTDGGKLTLSCGDAEIDSAEYDMVDAGVSRQFDGGGVPDYTANDDLTNWCAASEDGSEEFEAGNFGTPGEANEDCEIVVAGQCNDGGTPRDTVVPIEGDLVLTEVMPSPSAVGDDDGEWFEVLVTRNVDLNGVGLSRDGTSPDVIESEDCVAVTAGTYLVFARNAMTDMNGGLPPVTAEFDFTMVAGSPSSPGNVTLLSGLVSIDSFTWTATENGASLQVDPDFEDVTGNDLEANWCDGVTAYNGTDLGTPGAANEQCAVVVLPGQCIEEGSGDVRDIVIPTATDLVVSEVQPAPHSEAMGGPGTDGEFVEIRAVTAFDLNGLQIGDHNTAPATAVTFSTCRTLTAGSYAVFARSIDPLQNGGIEGGVAAFPPSVTANNSDGRIDIAYEDVIVGSIGWATSTTGVSIQVDAGGTQCNAPAGTPTYGTGTEVGTPGAAHTIECPL